MFLAFFSKFSSEIKSCEFYLQHNNIIKICCLHPKQHSVTIYQLFINSNMHIEEHMETTKLAENLGYFFFWWVYICACCLHVNKFFSVHTNHLKVLRNQIWCTSDHCITFEIFHFDLPSKISKNKK